MNEVLCFKNGSFYDTPDLENVTIQGKQFRILMDLCFSHADWFSLRRSGWPGAQSGFLEKALQPYCAGEYLSYRRNVWFEKESREKCLLYPASEEVKNIFLQHIHHLFGREEDPAPEGHQERMDEKYAACYRAMEKASDRVTEYMDCMGGSFTEEGLDAYSKEAYREAHGIWLEVFDEADEYSTMEDPCFFRGGEMFFQTITHEDDCFEYVFSDEFGAGLKDLGEWADFSDRISLPLSLLKKEEGLVLYRKDGSLSIE